MYGFQLGVQANRAATDYLCMADPVAANIRTVSLFWCVSYNLSCHWFGEYGFLRGMSLRIWNVWSSLLVHNGGVELAVVCFNRLQACLIATVQAYPLAILHSWLVVGNHACIKAMLDVCTIAIVHACIVAVVQACTMALGSCLEIISTSFGQQVGIIAKDLGEHLGPLRQY